MSIFAKIKQSRKAAKEHKEKVAEKENTVVKVPYKHVPTHAAVDALSGAPSTWKQDDRQKIKEHHKRRSQMNFSRTASSLSTVSYLNSAAGPSEYQPSTVRNSTYSSHNPTWFDRGEQLHSDYPAQKRVNPTRNNSSHDSGFAGPSKPSPLGSHHHNSDDEVSPLGSSGNSTTSSSSDPLEMTNPTDTRRKSMPMPNPQRSQPIVYQEKDIFDRLHTSTTRKLGEAPLYDSPPAPVIVKGPMAALPTEDKAEKKKARWSFMGRKNPGMAN